MTFREHPQDITHWSTTLDGFFSYVFAAPVIIKGRWENKKIMIRIITFIVANHYLFIFPSTFCYVFAAPVIIKVRWENKKIKILNNKSDNACSNAVIYGATDVKVVD